jgi:hypothetical protein
MLRHKKPRRHRTSVEFPRSAGFRVPDAADPDEKYALGVRAHAAQLVVRGCRSSSGLDDATKLG